MKEQIKVNLQSINGIYLIYKLQHIVNGYTNIYLIHAKICGVNECNENALYISGIGCETLTFNEETTLDEFAIELLENYIQK